LYDDINHRTHFTGFMLEEEIAASLWGSTSSATHDTFSTRTEWTDWTFVYRHVYQYIIIIANIICKNVDATRRKPNLIAKFTI
jgi:hypothetical protein